MGFVPHSPKLTALAAGSLLAAAIATPALADPSYTLFGDASRNDGTVTLTSDAAPGYGGLDLKVPGDLQFNEITQLSTQYNIESDDDCKGGSPRFQLNVDGKNVFVYIGPAPSFTGCAVGTWQSTGNLIGSTDVRFDLSQLGGPQQGTYQDALALIGNKTVTGVQLVVDAGWAFSDQEQTVAVRNVDLESKQNGGGSGDTPTSKQDCKNGGWQTFTNPTFKNQGQCVAFVNHNDGVGNDDNRHEDDHDGQQNQKEDEDKHGNGHDD